MTDRLTIIQGDALEKLRELPDETVQCCVTDPPYGIGFMGREWDTFKPGNERKRVRTRTTGSDNPNLKGRIRSPAASPSSVPYDRSLTGQIGFQEWTMRWSREVYRVVSPGAYLLVCGAPRSYHRMACGLEDAGFELRDCIMWVFGSGFPKSHNLRGDWDGWGTALKPAWEPIVLARKPFVGTVAENVQKYGTGALNIDECRVEGVAGNGHWSGDDGSDATSRPGYDGGFTKGGSARPLRISHGRDSPGKNTYGSNGPGGGSHAAGETTLGRWPANIIHDGSDEVIAAFPPAPGQQRSAGPPENGPKPGKACYGDYGPRSNFEPRRDCGSASRFFYCAKASRSDRDEGLEGFDKKPLLWSSGTQSPGTFQSPNTDRTARNNHPTVKPTALMRYLVRLVCPPGGMVLDPFAGSGSTGKAALLEGMSAILIEREAEYVEIARRRCAALTPGLAL